MKSALRVIVVLVVGLGWPGSVIPPPAWAQEAASGAAGESGVCASSPEAGSITGTVREETGTVVVPGASVKASWTTGRRETRADATGRYVLCGLPVGEAVVVRAQAGGYGSESRELRVMPGAGTVRDLTIRFGRAVGPGVSSVAETRVEPGGGVEGRVVGLVVDARTGRPVASARVGRGEEEVTSTDGRGRFVLERVGTGRRRIWVEHLGYGRQEAEVEVPSEFTLHVTMRLWPRPVAVAPLRVEVESELRAPYLERKGFYFRRDLGFGYFFDPKYLTDWPGLRVGTVVARAPTARLYKNARGQKRIVFNRNARTCWRRGATFYVDDQRWGRSVPDFPASEIAAIEVYKGPSEAVGTHYVVPSCGLVLVWTWHGPNPYHHRN